MERLVQLQRKAKELDDMVAEAEDAKRAAEYAKHQIEYGMRQVEEAVRRSEELQREVESSMHLVKQLQDMIEIYKRVVDEWSDLTIAEKRVRVRELKLLTSVVGIPQVYDEVLSSMTTKLRMFNDELEAYLSDDSWETIEHKMETSSDDDEHATGALDASPIVNEAEHFEEI